MRGLESDQTFYKLLKQVSYIVFKEELSFTEAEVVKLGFWFEACQFFLFETYVLVFERRRKQFHYFFQFQIEVSLQFFILFSVFSFL